MYKLFFRLNDGLYSIVKSFSRGGWCHEVSHRYTEGEWNTPRSGTPFLAFATLDDAIEFAERETRNKEGISYEVWLCEAEGIKDLEFVLNAGMDDDDFMGYLKAFWKVAYDFESLLKLMDHPNIMVVNAPVGSVSCERVKPVEHVATVSDLDLNTYLNTEVRI